jgi:hypothetical protein
MIRVSRSIKWKKQWRGRVCLAACPSTHLIYKIMQQTLMKVGIKLDCHL